MSLNSYERKLYSSYNTLDITRNLISTKDFEVDIVYMNLKRRINGIILASWIFPSRNFIRINRLSSLKLLRGFWRNYFSPYWAM